MPSRTRPLTAGHATSDRAETKSDGTYGRFKAARYWTANLTVPAGRGAW